MLYKSLKSCFSFIILMDEFLGLFCCQDIKYIWHNIFHNTYQLWWLLLVIKYLLLINLCRHFMLFLPHHQCAQWVLLSRLYRWAKRETHSVVSTQLPLQIWEIYTYTYTHMAIHHSTVFGSRRWEIKMSTNGGQPYQEVLCVYRKKWE